MAGSRRCSAMEHQWFLHAIYFAQHLVGRCPRSSSGLLASFLRVVSPNTTGTQSLLALGYAADGTELRSDELEFPFSAGERFARQYHLAPKSRSGLGDARRGLSFPRTNERKRLVHANDLHHRGIVYPGDGMASWIPVCDLPVVVTLSSRCIRIVLRRGYLQPQVFTES